MEYFLLILAFFFMVAGIIGSFLPFVPGPPLSWLGLLLLYFVEGIAFNYWFLGSTFFIAAVITILDLILPGIGTKRFGGSRYGFWGATIGLILGIITPIPLGFIAGPFLGAFAGEMIYDSTDRNRAMKAATGSFLGFLTSVLMKFILSLIFLGLFLLKVWEFRGIWF